MTIDLSDQSSNASSFAEEDDQDWGDWVDDSNERSELHVIEQNNPSRHTQVRFHALFLDANDPQKSLVSFPSAKEALDDAKSRGFDVVSLIRKCELDALQVIRLFNHLRRKALQGTVVDPRSFSVLSGKEDFLNDDNELKPVEGYEEDGLLQIDFDELDTELGGNEQDTSNTRYISDLECQLKASQLAIHDLRQKITHQLGLDTAEVDKELEAERTGKGKSPAGTSRIENEDNHYFSSYASHDIHQTMISDKVRTLSYAKFLLSADNAHLIRGKTIMDVGCGSGILSMLAARAGAKEVIAIDASAVASRAKENVRVNGLEGIITVYHGRVEDLDQILLEYHNKVDVIVSEWMGYFLLYESMLPAVLYARDRYLQPQGLLAPSHTRMLLSAIADCDVIKERMGFWDDVYGFSMGAMRTGLADEAWTEMLKPEQIAASTETLLDLPLHSISPQQPSFSAPFALRVSRSCTIQAFVSWFDTWFTPDGNPRPQSEGEEFPVPPGTALDGLPPVETRCPEESEIRGLTLKRDNFVPRNTDGERSTGQTVSFTTSPFGLETHWKQTLFVLKEPIEAEEGSTIVGVMHSTPNEDNVRELDVEIHYSVRPEHTAPQTRRKSVEARTVQLFAVR